MHKLRLFCILLLTTACAVPAALSQWRCLYATVDDPSNGTGHNTVNVAVISEDTFVADVWTESVSNPRGTRNYFVPYALADSVQGRIWYAGYGGSATSGVYQVWSDGAFDEVPFANLLNIKGTSDGTIYGVNNDANHNLLVFKLQNDTVAAASPSYRQETGPNTISAVDVDGNGYVYVVNDTTTGKTNDIKIYPPVAQWTSHQDAPMRTVDLPDGVYKGIAVTPDGSAIFVSQYSGRKILKYVGSPATGYTADPGFTFMMADGDTVAGRGDKKPAPLNLAFKSPENILFAAADLWLLQEYSWGRIYLINPVTGALASSDSSVSVINVAKWNFDHSGTGVYNNRPGSGTLGNMSGYTSTFDVEFDAQGNLYSQSHYGWTVEKWTFDGTLPTLSLTSVEPIDDPVPNGFALSGNYPNPFNPSTVLQFSLPTAGPVVLEVYDDLGRKVATLVNGAYDAGTYRATFNASELPSGIYFARIQSGSFTATRKMLLTK